MTNMLTFVFNKGYRFIMDFPNKSITDLEDCFKQFVKTKMFKKSEEYAVIKNGNLYFKGKIYFTPKSIDFHFKNSNAVLQVFVDEIDVFNNNKFYINGKYLFSKNESNEIWVFDKCEEGLFFENKYFTYEQCVNFTKEAKLIRNKIIWFIFSKNEILHNVESEILNCLNKKKYETDSEFVSKLNDNSTVFVKQRQYLPKLFTQIVAEKQLKLIDIEDVKKSLSEIKATNVQYGFHQCFLKERTLF